MLYFAYSTINWGDTCDLSACFADIRGCGWRAVELFGHTLDWLGTPQRLQALLGDLRAATLFGSIELSASGRQLTVHKNRVDYCAAIGANTYSLVGAGRPRHRPPTSGEIHELAALCDAIAEHGASRGVTVAYHPHTRCTVQYESEIDALMDATRQLTLCLDISHIALVGEDPAAHLRKYRARLGSVHLKDYGNGDFVELGRGAINIDIAGFLRELEAQQFAGWVVVEQSTSDVSARHSAELNAAYVRALGYAL
jgi:sugar phosphate isomerase/epimerase